jgi:hypothetical protein
MPEHIQPSRGLGSGAQPSSGREHARKGQRVHEGNEGGEQVAASTNNARDRKKLN